MKIDRHKLGVDLGIFVFFFSIRVPKVNGVKIRDSRYRRRVKGDTCVAAGRLMAEKKGCPSGLPFIRNKQIPQSFKITTTRKCVTIPTSFGRRGV